MVRASDSRPEGLGSMPPNTLRVHTEYVLVKSVGPKVLWAESRVQENNSLPFSFMPKFWRWRSSCTAEQFHSDASLEAVDRRAPNNSKNWQWMMEGDVSVRRTTPASHGGD
ncbi:uncharacterized protein TNCV_345871 [Trichonephila clavipes]|nr:uncharacterized protein TNCV_345871 [Trichonephila clavipes]